MITNQQNLELSEHGLKVMESGHPGEGIFWSTLDPYIAVLGKMLMQKYLANSWEFITVANGKDNEEQWAYLI